MEQQQQQSNLKDALFEGLRWTFIPEMRGQGEERIKVIQILPGYASDLIDLACAEAIEWPIRQLAAVLLKKHIELHWSSSRDKFEEPELTKEVKVYVKAHLLSALVAPTQSGWTENCPEKKLRSLFAHAISLIAYCDWPEDWEDLFSVLIAKLTTGDAGVVYGVMKVFNEICHEITDNQIPSIAPVLIPKMYDIFVNTGTFSIGTRCRAVQIFSIISETVLLMEQWDSHAVHKFLEPYLPQFTEALLKTLQLPDNDTNIDIALKKSVLNALSILVKNCRKRIWKWMPHILTPVWGIITNSAPAYLAQIVNTDTEQGNDGQAEPPVDSDGEMLSIDGVILSVFEFISVLTESSRSRKLIKQGMRDLLYYILIYMQITDEQMHTWIANPDQFVEDEDEESYAYTVRISGLDIILSLAKEYEEDNPKEFLEFQQALIETIKKHFEESNNAMQVGNPNWWKIQEACLTALGSLSLSFTEQGDNNQLTFEIKCILDHVFSQTAQPSVFYTGRSLWTVARFAPIMNETMIQGFLRSIVNGFQNASPIIQISALRSAYNICAHLQDTKNSGLVRPHLNEILQATLKIGQEHSTEVLKLCFETIQMLIPMDAEFALRSLDQLSPLLLNAFLSNAQDPLMTSVVQDIFKELFKHEQCLRACEQKLIPTLMDILRSQQHSENTQVLKPVALDVITTFVRNYPAPLSTELLTNCFPLICNCVLSTFDDNTIMQDGGECVRAFVSKAAKQLDHMKDPSSGISGMQLVMKVCFHLLDPRVSESCSAFVGKLIFVTISKGSEYLGNENIHLLLRSVLSKLQTSETLSVLQGLIMVFAHLTYHNLNTVLEFLSSLPGPSGTQTALEFVLNHWLNKQHLFYGVYEGKVTMLALCKLFEHSIVNSGADANTNLNKILVPGEPIVDNNVGVKTRSRTAAKPDQWTMIPCSIKILKLLIHELNHIQDEERNCDDNEEDDSDDENDDNGNGDGCNEMFNQSSVHDLLEEIAESEFEEDEDDPDILNDPISKLNLEQHLSHFLKDLLNTSLIHEFLPQLNDMERNVLTKLAQAK